jgi:PAS domain S-box-containing protein
MDALYEIETALILVWAFLVLIKKQRSKKGDIDLFLLFVTTTSYIAFIIYDLIELPTLLFNAALYGGLAYTLLMFDIKAVLQKDVNREKLKSLKKDYKALTNRSEMLRKRFIALLERMQDGVLFIMEDGQMFATDQAVNLLGFDENELTYETFLDAMHPEDKEAYLALTSKRKSKNDYTAHYRIMTGNSPLWIKESGTKVSHEKRTMTLAIIQSLDVKKYPRTNMDVLNGLKIDQALFERLQTMNSKGKEYTLIYFQLANIPFINERYGRDVGDLMMGEFISKLIYHFLGDAEALFRITGIRYAMVIEDQRKYGMLKRALEEGGDLVNYTMSFGGTRQSVYPYFGIHTVNVFEEPVDEIAARAEKALNIALDDKTQENYFMIG